MVASLLYSLVRVLFDVMVTRSNDQAELQAEVLALRRQVQVLERQIKRVRWSPADRMILAADFAPNGPPVSREMAHPFHGKWPTPRKEA